MTEPTGPALRVQSLTEAFSQATQLAGATQAGKAAADSARLVELASQAPVIRLVDQMLLEAVKHRASDIHVEAFEQRVRVRYRIDGRCYDVAQPPKSLALALASRLKVLASLDVAESRLPQDGRILMTLEARQIDLRMSTLPTLHGESIVLRVLDQGTVAHSLTDLGMASEMQQRMEELIQRPHGLLLVTGPTGSGKTTTLYACLAKLHRPEVKVITTEDPVEYDIDGLVQVAVNPKIDLSFASCLRAILRHDPDVVMIGEMRDQETAQVAIQASLTGHRVFSTLHTNDAPGAVTRLLDMGLEPFLITSTISGIVAQRLVRRLCPECRVPSEHPVEELAALGFRPEAERSGQTTVARAVPSVIMRAVGCDACQHIGYKGRTGIYELMVVSEELHPLILKRASLSELRAKAGGIGMRSLREDGVAKVLAGATTVDEVLRETQDYAA